MTVVEVEDTHPFSSLIWKVYEPGAKPANEYVNGLVVKLLVLTFTGFPTTGFAVISHTPALGMLISTEPVATKQVGCVLFPGKLGAAISIIVTSTFVRFVLLHVPSDCSA